MPVPLRTLAPSPAACLLGFCGVLAVGLAGWARRNWWARMPWGLVTVWRDLPPLPVFRSLSVGIEIERDPPATAEIYLAPIGLAWLNDVPFYCGLMSGAPMPGGGRDRIAIFSRWDERRREAIREASGGFSQSAGHEGDFIGVRNRVPWRRGRYTITLAEAGRDAQGIWVEMSVRDEATRESWIAGSLRFPGRRLTLRPHIAAFVELFGEPKRPSDVPDMRVRYGDLRINGVPVPIRKLKAMYRMAMPPLAEATAFGDGAIAIRTGQPVSRTHLARERGHYTDVLRG